MHRAARVHVSWGSVMRGGEWSPRPSPSWGPALSPPSVLTPRGTVWISMRLWGHVWSHPRSTHPRHRKTVLDVLQQEASAQTQVCRSQRPTKLLGKCGQKTLLHRQGTRKQHRYPVAGSPEANDESITRATFVWRSQAVIREHKGGVASLEDQEK